MGTLRAIRSGDVGSLPTGLRLEQGAVVEQMTEALNSLLDHCARAAPHVICGQRQWDQRHSVDWESASA